MVNRRSIAFLAFSLVLGVVVVVGYRWGTKEQTQPSSGQARLFRVFGTSMEPTLRQGQICQMRPLRIDQTLRLGELVAIEQDGGLRVKRVAGTPGDAISVSEGRLTNSGTRLGDFFALFQSWSRDLHKEALWSGSYFVPPALVPVRGNSPMWHRPKQAPEWLLYTHHDPHRGGQPGPVMDDYPSNKTVQRQLNPIDTLIVRVANRPRRFPDRIAFFSSRTGTVMLSQESTPLSTESGHVVSYSSRDAIRCDDANLLPQAIREQMSPSTPIAVHDGGGLGSDPSDAIRLFREIEYRDDQITIDYPIRLAEDEYFVVGDNVPISIDSRTHGPVKRSSIRGTITIPSSPDRL